MIPIDVGFRAEATQVLRWELRTPSNGCSYFPRQVGLGSEWENHQVFAWRWLRKRCGSTRTTPCTGARAGSICVSLLWDSEGNIFALRFVNNYPTPKLPNYRLKLSDEGAFFSPSGTSSSPAWPPGPGLTLRVGPPAGSRRRPRPRPWRIPRRCRGWRWG